jgi:hypothetical protein
MTAHAIRWFLIGTLASLVLRPLTAADKGIAAIWAVNDGERIGRDDLADPNKKVNSAWDGHRVRLFAARNEIVAFQVIVETDRKGVEKLSVSLPALTLRGGKAQITYKAPVTDPSDYAGRPIQVFTVNYMNVTEPTHASWIYEPGSPAAPRNPTGWKPVQLVPENARPGRGGFPLRVEPLRNQAIWIEVYTGRRLPAGVYDGSILIHADGAIRNVPVELRLFDFVLPDENSMHAMIYYSGDQPELYQGRTLDAQYHRFAHRQRIELVQAYNMESAKSSMGRFLGTDFAKTKGYEGPGEGIGNQIVPASFYGPGRDYDEKAAAWARSDSWMTFLKENLPHAITFLYMPDEPGPSEFPRIWRIARNIHSNPGAGRALPIFVTHEYTRELDGAIDIWDSGPQFYDVRLALKERAEGRDWWVYNGGRPASGALVMDAPATDARAIIWGCFKHGIRVYFYWHGVHWQHNTQKQGERNQDVWRNPVTFDNRGQPRKPAKDQGFANGDGVLIYPGEEKLHPSEDRGVAGPCSTIQLANLRRGLQDHQYLTLARTLGLEAPVGESIAGVVPRVFSEAKETVGFAETGDAYEAARLKLAQAIEALLRQGAGARRPQ